MNIKSILFIITIISLFLSISSCKNTNNYNIAGTYYQGDGKYTLLSLTLWQVGDSIIGNHTFITQNGNRIDFCEDVENTIHLKREKNNTYNGTIINCYSFHEPLDISIEKINDTTIKFTFLKADHPFLSENLEFVQEKE